MSRARTVTVLGSANVVRLVPRLEGDPAQVRLQKRRAGSARRHLDDAILDLLPEASGNAVKAVGIWGEEVALEVAPVAEVLGDGGDDRHAQLRRTLDLAQVQHRRRECVHLVLALEQRVEERAVLLLGQGNCRLRWRVESRLRGGQQ